MKIYKRRACFAWFLIALMTVQSLGVNSLMAQTPGQTYLAVVGFRADQYGMGELVRDEISKRLAGEKSIALAPELVTSQVVGDVWHEEAKESKEKVKDARRFFIEGKKLYDKLALDDAIRNFNNAVIRYREGVDALRDNRYLLVSHLYLGMSLVVLGKVSEGKRYIREMVVLDANREKRVLSEREFPPHIIKMHKSITEEVMKGSFGRLALKTDPKGAKIYVNGLLQPTQGQLDIDLPVGEHFIVVEQTGYKALAKRIAIQAGNNPLEIALEEWRPLGVYSLERRNNLIALEDLNNIAKEVSANILVLGDVSDPDNRGKHIFSAQLFDARSQEFSRIQTTSETKARASSAGRVLGKKLADQITAQGFVVADIRSPAFAEAPSQLREPENEFQISTTPTEEKRFSSPKERESLWSSPWFWGGLGALVLGAGVAGFMLIKPGQASSNVLVFTPSP